MFNSKVIITVSSEKEEKKEDQDKRFTRREYSYSTFSRSFTLPDEIVKDKIEAKYEDGVLRIRLPYNEEVKKTHCKTYCSKLNHYILNPQA